MPGILSSELSHSLSKYLSVQLACSSISLMARRGSQYIEWESENPKAKTKILIGINVKPYFME